MDQEQYLFYKYKDTVVVRKKFLRKVKENFKNVDAEKIYRDIIDYQIFTYGQQLMYNNSYNKESNHRVNTNANKRRWYHGIKKAWIIPW